MDKGREPKLKRLLHGLRKASWLGVLRIIDAGVSIGRPERRPNTVLLVRLDAIGDYILFRNFMEPLRTSRRFHQARITLCGNLVWRDLAETFDRRFVDDFIWIDRKRFRGELLYRSRVLRHIHQRGFQTAIYPAHAREMFFGEAIVKASSAPQRIGTSGDPYGLPPWQRRLTDRYYTHLIDTGEKTLFEFERNKRFFEILLGGNPEVKKPFLPFTGLPQKEFTPAPYMVLFPGAGEEKRRWAAENFAALAEHVAAKYGLDVLVAGSSGDAFVAREVVKRTAQGSVKNITGKTTLSELVGVIARARLLVTNDTSAVHMGVAVGTRTVCVSNGKHYGRFLPYPPGMAQALRVVFPRELYRGRRNHLEVVMKYRAGSTLDINSITVTEVARHIGALLETPVRSDG